MKLGIIIFPTADIESIMLIELSALFIEYTKRPCSYEHP